MKRKLFSLLLLLLCLFPLSTSAQDGKLAVRGSVTDAIGEKLVGAHLSFATLGTPEEKTDVVSDKDGQFEVRLPLNYYTLRVTYTGYAPYEARVECVDSIQMPPIVLQESSSELAGVVVKASRISYNAKGYVASIANDPLFKTRTLAEAMRMLPGLHLEDGEFHAYGEKIGSVFVNNKRLMYKGADLVSYLRTLQAKNIVSVQVLNSTADPLLTDKMAFVIKITTTSAEDGGNATIGVSARASSVYDFQAKPTLNIQQRVGKWSMFLMPDYTPRSMLNRGEHSTTVLQESGVVRRETRMGHLKSKPQVWLTGGLSYEFDKNNNISLNLSGMHQKRLQTSETHNGIFEGNLQTGSTDGYVGERRKINQFEGMLNYFGELPVATLYGSIDYAFKEDDGHTDRNQTLAGGQQTLFGQDKTAYYHLLSGSLSATWKLAKAHKVNTSATATCWDNKNDYNQSLADNTSRYRYLYKESSFDGSLGYEYSKDVWEVNVGTRYLTSHMKPQVVQDGLTSYYTRDVNKFLPFATITYIYDPKEYKTIMLQYERSYDFSNLLAMDPTTDWRSEYTYQKGNPNLNPGFTDKVALQTRIGKFIIRGRFENDLSNVSTYALDDAGNEIQSYDNGLHSQVLFFNLDFPLVQFSPRCRLNYYATYLWKKESYGHRKQVTSQVTGGFTLMGTLPGRISFNCSARLNSPQRSFYSNIYCLGNIDASLGKWLWKNKWYAGLSCSYSFLSRTSVRTPIYRMDSRYDRAMLMVNLSLSYRVKWGNKRARVNSNRVISTESMRMN